MTINRVSTSLIATLLSSPARLMLFFGTILLAGTVLQSLLLETFMQFHGDIYHYQRTAEAMLNGNVLYSEVAFEYPPLAAVPMLVSQLVESWLGGGIRTFIFAFGGLQLLVVSIVSTYLPWKNNSHIVIPFACSLFLLAPLALLRLDGFVLSILIGMFYAMNYRKWWLLSFLAVMGLSFKLIPIVIAGLVVVHLVGTKNWREATSLSLKTGSLCIVAVIGTWFAFGDAPLSMFAYHSERGLQLESIFSALTFFASGHAVEIQENYGALHIQTAPFVSLVLSVTSVGLAIFAAITSRDSVGTSVFLGLMVFILFGKVFSPQYMLWFLPLLFFCDQKAIALWLVAVLTTVIVFPIGYIELQKEWWFFATIAIRWLVLIGLVVRLGFRQHDGTHCLTSS